MFLKATSVILLYAKQLKKKKKNFLQAGSPNTTYGRTKLSILLTILMENKTLPSVGHASVGGKNVRIKN